MPSSRDIDRTILDLAARTQSVVHARDLRAHGISRGVVAARVRTGWMAPMVGLSYGVGPMCHAPTFEMQCMAGALAGGVDAVVDAETAGALLGVWNRKVRTVHVTVPGRGIRQVGDPFVFHRATGIWIPEAHGAAGAIPVAGLVQMCRSFARSHTPWQLAFLIRSAVHARLGTLASLEEAARTRARAPGSRVMRCALQLIEERSQGTRSATEDAILAELLRSGGPMPVVNTKGAMGIPRDEPDFVWPAVRRNVECDGGHHEDAAQRADDAERDAAAATRGWQVLRVRACDYWRQPRRVVRSVLHFVDGGDVDLRTGTRTLRV